jgi:hypothetical protein
VSATRQQPVTIRRRAIGELRPHEHTELPPLPPLAQGALRDDIHARGIVEPLEITPDGLV